MSDAPTAVRPAPALEGEEASGIEQRRNAGRLIARRGLVLWAAVVVVACLGRESFLRVLLEGGLFVGLLALLLRQELVQSTLATLRRPAKIFLALLVALMLYGHLRGRSADTYPFATWGMYTRRVDRAQHYYEFSGVLADGREVPLRITQRFPVVRRQLLFKVSITSDLISGTTNETRRAKLVANYEQTLRALGLKYNADYPTHAMVAVRVWRHDFRLEDFQRTGVTSRKLFWETPLAPGQRPHAF